MPKRSRMPITTITLDAAGTLIRTTHPVGDTYLQIAKAHGAELDAKALAHGFGETYAAMPPMAFTDAGGAKLDALERDWWRALVRQVTERAGGVKRFDDFFTSLYSYYAKGSAWTLYPEVLPVLTGLAARGYRLAVISNFDSRLPGVLSQLGVLKRFESIVFSTEAGAAKPDPGIFEEALKRLHITAEEALHAGDNSDADFAGARAMGMHALLLRRSGGATPPHEAVDLQGIWPYLEQLA
ncbi:MAG: HAD-IA family hydrolase [Gammaproteobacteria bacterium]|nr:HAD-IA family hydrolase [Gammaproteobacteria bacterium]